MKLGIDLGFGFTKIAYATPDGNITTLKFPSWVAYFERTPMSQIEPIEVDGIEYVVGEYAKYERQKLEMASIEEFVKLSPILVKEAIRRTGSPTEMVVGIAPKFKDYRSEIEKRIHSTIPGNYELSVMPQGFGAYIDLIDTKPELTQEDILIVDIGFNTVDYILISNGKRIKGNTIEKLGMTEAVNIFRSLIPPSYSQLQNYSPSRLLQIFESPKGEVLVMGSTLNLSSFREKAIIRYSELVLSRLKEEVGSLITEIPYILVVGGGAYYVKLPLRNVIIPDQPEYANARGFLKYTAIKKES